MPQYANFSYTQVIQLSMVLPSRSINTPLENLIMQQTKQQRRSNVRMVFLIE